MSGKAILSNKIYMSDTSDGTVSWATALKEACTHKIPLPFNPNQSKFAKPYKILKSYSYLGKGIFTVPSGRFDLIPDYFEKVDKRVLQNRPNFPTFLKTHWLRDSQLEAAAFANDNCLISARPGWGKTFTGLYIASLLKQKTLIVVHTKALMEQWIEEIQSVFGMDRSQVGTIWEGRVDIKEHITIGIVKTIHNNRLAISKEFGLVIVDEVHHLPADQFSGFIDTSHARYKIGMTGTLARKDQKHALIFDYISTRVFEAPDENVMTPTVDVIKIPLDFDKYIGVYAARVTAVNEDPAYIRMAASICRTYADMGHKILFVGDRIAGLEAIKRELGSRASLYHSSLTTAEKDAAFAAMRTGKTDILIGSIKIFMEGISENYLSCLILGASVSGPPLDQLIGRVIRKHPDKIEPVIVDILLAGRTMKRHQDDRCGTYEKAEYEVNYYGQGESNTTAL